MNKLIAVLPCSNADELIEFYKNIGFELVGKFIRSYLILQYEEIELHFYGTNKVPPEANSSMCIIRTDDVEKLYETFSSKLKTNTGKIPRSGFGKITKIRNLSDDRRFTLTDPSGNTFYILTPNKLGEHNFFRELDNKEYAEKYAILYDLLYSKEDLKAANNMLGILFKIKEQLNDLDKAKLFLINFEINQGLKINYDKKELMELINNNKDKDDWKNIENKLNEIINN